MATEFKQIGAKAMEVIEHIEPIGGTDSRMAFFNEWHRILDTTPFYFDDNSSQLWVHGHTFTGEAI